MAVGAIVEDEAIWIDKERISQIWEELHDDTKKLPQIANIVDAC